MSYRLKPERAAAAELRRVVRKQLDLAATELTTTVQPPGPVEVHEARRHIKKARAALGLVSGTRRIRRRHRKLRRAARLLARIADGEAMLRAFDKVRSTQPALESSVAEAVRRHLTDSLAEAHRRAVNGGALERVIRLLKKERRRTRAWPHAGDTFALVAPGFERTVRRARRAMMRTLAKPTIPRYHTWRRRAKDHWLQVRLLDARCQGRLAQDAHLLAELDVALGASHDLAMLAVALRKHSTLSRPDLAATLRLIRRERQHQRREAARLGALLYRETPEEAAERVGRAWCEVSPASAKVEPLSFRAVG